MDLVFRMKTSTDGWLNLRIFLALPWKSMKVKIRSKKALETGEMKAKSFVSLINHFGVFECVLKVV